MMRNDSRCVVGRATVAGHVRAINGAAPFAQPLQKSHLLQNRILTAGTVGIKLDSDRPRVKIVQPYFDFKRMLFGAGRHFDCFETQAAKDVERTVNEEFAMPSSVTRRTRPANR